MSQASDEERSFLHDLASPIGTLSILLEVLGEEVEKNETASEISVSAMAQSLAAVERIKNLLNERRELLINRGVAGE